MMLNTWLMAQMWLYNYGEDEVMSHDYIAMSTYSDMQLYMSS